MSPSISTLFETETVNPLGVHVGGYSEGGTYFRTLVGRGPLAYWRFGELGFVTDVIGEHYGVFVHTPSTVGEPALAASLVPGDPDPSILLGAGVSIQVPYGTWMDTEAFGFEGVFEVTGTTTTPSAVVTRASVEKFCWGLLLSDDQLVLSTGAQDGSMTLANGIYHYMVAGDTDTITVYLNGAEALSLPAQPDMNTGGAFSFGAPLPGFSYEAFPGRLDEFVYYDFRPTVLDAYADWLLWTLGQAGSIDMVVEADTVGSVTPRHGAGQTYRRVVTDDGAWSYWAHAVTGRGTDSGDRDHDATVTSPSVWDPMLGPTQVGVESPVLLANSGSLESEDLFASSDCTQSIWLSVGAKSGSIAAEIPLACMAPSEGAATFDKCLYLDTSGHLNWLTGTGGSLEVITDPDPFPQDGVARHVVVSVGAAGTKIRVSGDTKVTGANTTSWTTGQKVFYFTGGTGGGHDFTSNGAVQRLVWLQATVFDTQLDDTQTDEHWRVGRSIRNIEYFWGVDSPSEALSFGSHDLLRTGRAEPLPGSPGILVSDPLLGSTALTESMEQSPVYGTWTVVTGTQGHREIRHVYWEPSSLAGTQVIAGLITGNSQFSVSPSSVVSVDPKWRLLSVAGVLTWKSRDVTNALVDQDTFAHSVPLTDGVVNAIGMELNGAALDLWVNGVKESFTRTQSAGWPLTTAGNQVSGYEFGGTITPSPIPATSIEVLTGRVAQFLYNGASSPSGFQGGGADYDKPERFFEDLAAQVADIQLSITVLDEVETVFELEVGLAAANQAITIDRVDEADLLFEMGQVPPMITTLIEVSEAFMLIQAGDPADVTVQGVGRVSLVDETLEFFAAELRLRILDPEVLRAPTSITVMLSGGVAYEDVVFAIDGTPVYTVSLDSDGNLGPTSINLTTTLGTMGAHLLSVTQTTSEGVTADSQSFTVLREPSPFPGVAGVDAPPVEVPDALAFEGNHVVRHWVFQDLLAEADGGIGSYVLPHSPRNMTSPHLEHALTSKHSTAHDGKIHVFQAGNTPKEWQFTGYCPSAEQQARMTEYRNLNRRFYVIDHRNRAWKVAMVDAQFVPRLRQNYNGVDTDWGSDFTITAVVLDQNYQTPEA